ncbi:MAG: prephenate dehydratase, partial [Actinobacteria bacterium]|nr:prephenate dehydratase [Actinomycetota bacterium]
MTTARPGPKIGYLGPQGTFTEEALLAALGPEGAAEHELVGLATIHDTIMAVQDGRAQFSLVAIENSLEGSVDVTLDALAVDAPDVRIVGEVIRSIRHCLIASDDSASSGGGSAGVDRVLSHPQVLGQCAVYLRSLGSPTLVPTSSSAEAVRLVVEAGDPAWAALGTSLAA